MNKRLYSDNCVNLIKEYEGFESKPYLCPAGVPTIGYGTTIYPYGDYVDLRDPAISEKQATRILLTTIDRYSDSVDRYLKNIINQSQFDALVSIAYNIGLTAFRKSTLLKRVNENPNDPDIAYQFSRWKRGGGRILQGLVRRRTAEAELYFSETVVLPNKL